MQDEPVASAMMPIGTAVTLLQQDFPDVTHSSLRFLEREGLVVPTRTSGGHRLYSPDDIQRVRQIKLWQQQRLSLSEIRDRLEALDAGPQPEALAHRFLEAASRGDVTGAQQVILGASDLGMPLETLLLEVLRPALWETGNRWELGTLAVAQEKEISGIANELIAELSLRHTGPEEGAYGAVVAASVAGEQHQLGLRIITTLLRARHVNVHFLGPAVDPEFLVEAAQLRQPQAVLLSATLDDHLPNLLSAMDALREAGIDAPVVAGGQAVSRHRKVVGIWGIEIADDNIDSLVDRLTAVNAAAS